MDVSKPSSPRWLRPEVLLALLRIYLGVVFLVAVVPKIAGDSAFAPLMNGFLENVGLSQGHGFYQPFLESVVMPRDELFAGLVVAGEAVAAIGLITGAATRLAGAVAAVLALNYMFAKGVWLWTPSSNDAAFLVIALVVVAGAAGRTLGVDRLLADRFAAWPLG